jgi:hypothetical protein
VVVALENAVSPGLNGEGHAYERDLDPAFPKDATYSSRLPEPFIRQDNAGARQMFRVL